jgi:hypothetical protein
MRFNKAACAAVTVLTAGTATIVASPAIADTDGEILSLTATKQQDPGHAPYLLLGMTFSVTGLPSGGVVTMSATVSRSIYSNPWNYRGEMTRNGGSNLGDWYQNVTGIVGLFGETYAGPYTYKAVLKGNSFVFDTSQVNAPN